MSDDDKRTGQDEKPSQAVEDQHDNVIRFPVERVKSKRKLKKLAGKMNDNKKTTLFLSLLSVMVFSAYLLQNLGGGPSREMASTDVRDMGKEKILANQLQNPENRNPASYGRKPSSEEYIRKDLPNFVLNHEEGMLDAATENPDFPSSVKLVDLVAKYEGEHSRDLSGFVMSYRDYFYPTFQDVEPFVPDGETNMQAISYQLMRAGKPTGFYIRIDVDRSEKVTSIKVQAIR